MLAARLLLLPILPLTDPTEGRYALIAKDIVQTGNWITPHIWIDGQRVPFLGKPPLYFWAEAACMKVLGINELAARLPGLVSFGLTLLIMGVVLNYYTNRQIAQRAVFLCLSSVVMLIASGIVIVDMLVTLCVTGALFAYYAFSRETRPVIRRGWSIVIFVMLGFGFLTKGPIIWIMFGLPILLWTFWTKQWQDILAQEWYLGIAILAVMIIPWFMLMEDQHPGFLRYFFVNENLFRFLVHDYGDKYGSGHEYIRGSAIWMMIAVAMPWSLYAMYRMIQRHKQTSLWVLLQQPESAFFFCVFVSQTLFWCMARQLLMTYLFAAVPAFMAWLSIQIEYHPEWGLRNDPIFKKTAILISLLTLAGLAGSLLFMSNRSAKDVVAKAAEISSRQGTLYFLRRVPYSAYFYGGDMVIAHPDEPASAFDIKQGDRLYAAGNKYYSKLPKNIQQNAEILSQKGGYVLFRLSNIPAVHLSEPSAVKGKP